MNFRFEWCHRLGSPRQTPGQGPMRKQPQRTEAERGEAGQGAGVVPAEAPL